MAACEKFWDRQKSPSSHPARIVLAQQPGSGAMRQGQIQSAGAHAFSAYDQELASLGLTDAEVDLEVVFSQPWTARSGA